MPRTYAADSFDDIRLRMGQIREAEQPMCPINTSRTLYSCLRASSRCTDSCPHHSEWIGPQAGE